MNSGNIVYKVTCGCGDVFDKLENFEDHVYKGECSIYKIRHCPYCISEYFSGLKDVVDKEYKDHIEDCPYRPCPTCGERGNVCNIPYCSKLYIKCPECFESMKACPKVIHKHDTYYCPWRRKICPICSASVHAKYYDPHVDEHFDTTKTYNVIGKFTDEPVVYMRDPSDTLYYQALRHILCMLELVDDLGNIIRTDKTQEDYDENYSHLNSYEIQHLEDHKIREYIKKARKCIGFIYRFTRCKSSAELALIAFVQSKGLDRAGDENIHVRAVQQDLTKMHQLHELTLAKHAAAEVTKTVLMHDVTICAICRGTVHKKYLDRHIASHRKQASGKWSTKEQVAKAWNTMFEHMFHPDGRGAQLLCQRLKKQALMKV